MFELFPMDITCFIPQIYRQTHPMCKNLVNFKYKNTYQLVLKRKIYFLYFKTSHFLNSNNRYLIIAKGTSTKKY